MADINDILADQVHGSTFLAKKSLTLIIEQELGRDELRSLLDRISNQFPDMHIMESIRSRLQSSDDPWQTAHILLDSLENSISTISQKLDSHLTEDSSVITYSHSQTLQGVLQRKSYTIYCMISQPQEEGKILASNLKTATAIADTAGKQKILNRKVDALLLGCDQYSDNVVINKIGSKELIQLCHKMDLPVYVLTSSLKYNLDLDTVSSEMFEKCPILDNVFIIADN